jgi:hypothetical protein
MNALTRRVVWVPDNVLLSRIQMSWSYVCSLHYRTATHQGVELKHHLIGILKLSIFYWQKRIDFHPSHPASFLIGTIFALGWTPCVGLVRSRPHSWSGKMHRLFQSDGLTALFGRTAGTLVTRNVIAVAVIALPTIIGVGLLHPGGASTGLGVGDAAPNFTLTTLDGKQVSLSSLGATVVGPVDESTSSCGHHRWFQ